MQGESVSLRFQQGFSDKVYNASLIPKDTGWLVNFAYGRRGSPLKHGTKTATPLPYDQAKRAYDKLVGEKTSKGYTSDPSGSPFVSSEVAQLRTGWLPQLLNPIEPSEVAEALLRANGELAVQVKYDGERRIVIVSPTEIYGSNRRGLKVPLLPEIQNELAHLRSTLDIELLVLDAEDMGNALVIFDVLAYNDDLRNAPFRGRADYLVNLEESNRSSQLLLAHPTYLRQTNQILALADVAEKGNEEGIVLRDPNARYEAGRPNSWGPCLKIKFYATATCWVGNIHPTKRSIALMLQDKEEAIDVGNCTIPPNYKIPSLGDLVEIKYLYAYPGGSLYQPQYKGVRTDLERKDACISQLKFKE